MVSTYVINVTFKDDSENCVRVSSNSPQDALKRLAQEPWYESVLRIDSVCKLCDVEIEQPEFHLDNEFTIDDVDTSIKNYHNQYVIRRVSPMRFADAAEYRTVRYQIVKAVGGFGCDAAAMGNAVYVIDADGESWREERYNILGVASEKAMERWRELVPDSEI